MLVGLVVSWPAVAVGAALAIVFGALWVRDMTRPRPVAAAPVAAPAAPAAPPTYPRSKFLEFSTLGLGAVIGGAVTVPAVGLAIVPPFLKQGHGEIDLGPLSNFPEGQWVITKFFLNPEQGSVTERTAFVRNNGLVGNVPSFTIISNRCAHLGCPVQPNGPLKPQTKLTDTSGGERVLTQEALTIVGFGCPCHGGQYDQEGNRTAGPPVRALDRYEFSIKHDHLFLGKTYSVKSVTGSGASAKIQKYPLQQPGDHVGDWEAWLWPYNPAP
jgi:menaquinol-cytochrome c reductase iron-sulfur subunit